MLNDKNRLAMVLFIMSESIFFLLLIIGYVVYHVKGSSGPTASQALDLPAGVFFSAFLFSSSFTMWRADVSLRRKNRTRLAIWIGLTMILGAIFLFGQSLEYLHLLKQDITISRDLFGTTFFTLTGFHGMHVLTGLLLLGIMFLLAVFGKAAEPKASGMTAISYYWHFVDVVWIFIFSVTYLWAFL
ncbi:MAG: heme-copper oxidase subunit III [Candidatus Zixiibacteriota bacterium]